MSIGATSVVASLFLELAGREKSTIVICTMQVWEIRFCRQLVFQALVQISMSIAPVLGWSGGRARGEISRRCGRLS